MPSQISEMRPGILMEMAGMAMAWVSGWKRSKSCVGIRVCDIGLGRLVNTLTASSRPKPFAGASAIAVEKCELWSEGMHRCNK